MAPVRQYSFAGGEWAPELHGRADLPRYGTALRTCRNFYALPSGALESRGGMLHLAPAVTNDPGRLVPFVYSDTQSYVLEFGQATLRVWSAGAPVATLATPYNYAQLPRLKYAQSGDTMVLCHPSHAPRRLKRTAHSTWTLEGPPAFGFKRPDFYSYAATPRVLEEATPHSPDTAGSDTHPAREWKYRATTLGQLQDGTVFESAPYDVVDMTTSAMTYGTVPEKFAVHPGAPVQIDWYSAGLSPDPGYRVLALRFYRGRGSMFGYIGESRTTHFTDVGDEPDYSQPPPQGRNPFEVYQADRAVDAPGALLRTEEPSVVTYHDDRLCFARTDERPATVWGSRVGDYLNFDDFLPSVEDESVEYTLASRTREEVRWMLSLGVLLVGTNSSVWSLSSAEGGPLSVLQLPSARRHSSSGSNWMEPLVVGNSVLFARDKGGGVRELLWEEGRRSYLTNDVGVYSPHLLKEGLRDWAYAEDPHSIVWAVTTGGDLLSCTYLKGQEVLAWTRHDTVGLVRAVCTVPENGADAVYLLVERDSSYYVERLEAHAEDTEGVCLDAAVAQWASDGVTVTGLSHLVGKTVSAVGNGNAYEGLVVAPDGTVVVPTPEGPGSPAVRFVVGLPYLCQVETLGLAAGKAEAATKRKTVSEVLVDVVYSRGLWAGESLSRPEDMAEWQQREVAMGYNPLALQSARVQVTVTGGWNDEGRVALEQRAPFPLTITGLTREVHLGG